MPSLQDVLASVPGYGGFLARRQQIEQGEASDIQQAGALQKILAQQQAVQQERELRGVLAQSGGDPAKAMQALLTAGTPKSIELATHLKGLMPKPTEPYTLSEGAQRFGPDNKLLATTPKSAAPTELARAQAERAAMQPGDPRIPAADNYIRKLSETAKQISPTVIQEAPVTPVTIQDPNDPNSTIIIDGRTRKMLGRGPKLTEVGKANVKRQIASQGVGDAITLARDLLTGRGGQELPTESGIGAGIDYAASIFGATPKGAKSADRLRVVGGSLVQRVPRFEGPQSDKDVAFYKEVAGRIGDATLPIERRLAALDEVEVIWGQFEQGKKRGFFELNPRQSEGQIQGGWTPEKERRFQELKRKQSGAQ